MEWRAMGIIRPTKHLLQEYWADPPVANYNYKVITNNPNSTPLYDGARHYWYYHYVGGEYQFELTKDRQWIGLRNAPWQWRYDYSRIVMKFSMQAELSDAPEYAQFRIYLFDEPVDVDSLTWATQPALPSDTGQIIDVSVPSFYWYVPDIEDPPPSRMRYTSMVTFNMRQFSKADGTPYDLYALCVDIITTPPDDASLLWVGSGLQAELVCDSIAAYSVGRIVQRRCGVRLD
jgi:hypothetical protein